VLRSRAVRRSEIDPQDARAARRAALDSLARRDRPGAQLCQKLRDSGFDLSVAARVVETLTREGLVNDARFVEHYVAYHASRGQGPVRIRNDLRQMRIESELVEGFLGAYSEWGTRILEVRQKKFGARAPTDYAGKARQSRFLAYRGFTGAQIRLALGFDEEL
jgi:regulatory protein